MFIFIFNKSKQYISLFLGSVEETEIHNHIQLKAC